MILKESDKQIEAVTGLCLRYAFFPLVVSFQGNIVQ